jgi:aldehyde dehydrogenase (NAD+)
VSYLSAHRKRANAATFGLGSGVWTTNVSKAH